MAVCFAIMNFLAEMAAKHSFKLQIYNPNYAYLCFPLRKRGGSVILAIIFFQH
jgi:hypothetical protein